MRWVRATFIHLNAKPKSPDTDYTHAAFNENRYGCRGNANVFRNVGLVIEHVQAKGYLKTRLKR
jgi:hypothetical protein